MSLPLIQSGSFPDAEYVGDYRFERLGEVFVERVVWRAGAPERRVGSTAITGPGYLCFRFWLPAHDQVVERYFAPDGAPLGTMVDVCAPLVCQMDVCSTVDYLLDVWIDPHGGVTLFNERAFEAAVREGGLAPEQAAQAERRVRELTTGIARNRLPPPLVRNWRVDPGRIRADGGPV